MQRHSSHSSLEMEGSRCSSSAEWIMKMWYNIHNKILFSCKKIWYHEIPPSVSGTRIYYNAGGNPDPGIQTPHILFNLWILGLDL